MTKKEIVKHAKTRLDGWNNIFTGLGVQDLDKRTGMVMRHTFLRQQDVEALIHGDDIAEKCIDRLPEDMTREGFTVTSQEADELTEDIQQWFDEMGLDEKIEMGFKYARLYGGAGLVLGIDDGASPEKPVDLGKIRGIEYATILNRWDFAAMNSMNIDRDVKSPNFGKPKFYRLVQPSSGRGAEGLGSDVKIHYSRIIRFEGAKVHGLDRALVDYWGDSVLSKLWNAITNYQSTHDSVALIVQDVVKMIFKLKNLSDLVAQGKDGLIQARLNLIAKTASIINAIVVEEGEEAESKTTTVTGIPDLVNAVNSRLCAALEMPHTILLGESPSGLGATGDSEEKDWFKFVKKKQESLYRPIINRLVTLRMASKFGPTGGKIVPFTVTFNPLSVPSEKEKADARKVQADTDTAYVSAGVLDPEEVADSRFGSGTYSFETTLDLELRTALEKGAKETEAPDEEDATTQ